MHKIIAVVAVCLAITKISVALDCYNCAPPVQCENVAALTPISCGNAAVPPLRPACQKLTLKRRDRDQQFFLRRCVTAISEDDRSQCQAPLGFELMECNICFEDKCNAAQSARLSVITIVSIVCALIFGRVVLA